MSKRLEDTCLRLSKTRLNSIESLPKKVVVVVVVMLVVFVGAIIVGHKTLNLQFGKHWVNNKWCIVVVVFIVGHRYLAFKFGQNWVIHMWYIVVYYHCFSFVVVIVVVVIDVVVVDPET